MEGKFITFEGIDGSGKTSVLKGVIEHLNGKKIDNYIWTREPGGNRRKWMQEQRHYYMRQLDDNI